jgi:hypothetical protein
LSHAFWREHFPLGMVAKDISDFLGRFIKISAIIITICFKSVLKNQWCHLAEIKHTLPFFKGHGLPILKW